MGIIMNIRNKFLGEEEVRRIVSPSKLYIDTYKPIKKIANDYFSNLIVTLINKRSQAIANLEITALTTNNEPLSEEHWLSKLINTNANPLQSINELLSSISISLDYYGNAFILTQANNSFISALYIIPPTMVKDIIYNDEGQREYVLSKEFKNLHLDFTDIIHIKNVNYSLSSISDIVLRGEPYLLNASKELVKIENEINSFLQRYFNRDMIPPLVLRTAQTLTDVEWQQIRDRWNAVIKDYPILGLLEGGMEVNSVADGQFHTNNIKEINDIITTKLCSLWGVPPALITSQYQNRDTAYLQMNDFYNNTIFPIATNIIQTINGYLARYNLKLSIKNYDYSDQRSDNEFKLELFRLGVIEKDELREFLGLPKSVKQQNDQEVEDSNKTKANFDKYDEYYFDWLKKLDRDETTLKQDYIKAIDKIDKVIKSKITNMTKSIHKDGEYLINPQSIITAEEIEEILNEATKKSREDITKKAIEKASSDVDIKLPEQTIQRIKDKVIELNYNKIKINSETLSKEVAEILRKIIASNAYTSVDDILERFYKEINNKFNNEYKTSRVNAVVRTISTGINSTAQVEVWSSQNINMMWLSTRDKRVRDAHKEADKQIRLSKTPVGYLVGGEELPAPAMGNRADNNVNCRCLNFPLKM